MTAQETRAAEAERGGRAADRRTNRAWVPRTMAWVIGISGLLSIASVLTPHLYRRVHLLARISPFVTGAAAGATVFSGVLLLLLTKGLRRRKRRAQRVAVAVLAVTAVLHIARDVDVGQALFA